jgi:hypothetical protein
MRSSVSGLTAFHHARVDRGRFGADSQDVDQQGANRIETPDHAAGDSAAVRRQGDEAVALVLDEVHPLEFEDRRDRSRADVRPLGQIADPRDAVLAARFVEDLQVHLVRGRDRIVGCMSLSLAPFPCGGRAS